MLINLKFNYGQALSLLKAIDDYNISLDKIANRLGSEVAKTGTWWQGESYDTYNELFCGKSGGKQTIDRIGEDTAPMSDYLVEAAQTLKSWEQKSKENFIGR